MTTLAIFATLAWLLALAAVLAFSWLWLRAFLAWPGLTRQAILLGLLARLLAVAAAIAVVIGAPLDLFIL